MKAKLILSMQAATIVLAGWFVFSPVAHGGWIWDDPAEITQNPELHDLHGLAGIWSAAKEPDYYPLKTTLQWVQWHLWGVDPTGYHLTNIALHLLSALLLWRLLGKLGVRLAWLGGLIFAIHPLTVESVAWISELKNVLSLALLLAAFIAYVECDEAMGDRRSPAVLYALSILCFLAAMLSKSSVVMFPFILLLYAWWKRGRIARVDLRAAAPFFGISLILGAVTVWFQQHRAIADLAIPKTGFLSRIAVAGQAVAFYLFKSVVPLNLLPIYPRWNVDPPSLAQFLPWFALGALLYWLWTKRAAYGRHILFGFGCFLLNLAPVLGFVPMSYQRISWVADHFAYLPLAGLVGLAAAGISESRKWEGVSRKSLPPSAFLLPTFIIIVLAALAIKSRHYAANFKSEESLWTTTLARNPDAWLAHNNLGNILLDEGRVADAQAQFEAALRLKPDFAEAHNNLGTILMHLGRPEEARVQFEAALRIKPKYAEAENGLGNYLVQIGRPDEAIAYYEQALRLKPGYPTSHVNLGAALVKLGRLPEAMAQYEQALEADPNLPVAHYNLALALAYAGRFSEAISHYQQALRIKPDFPEAEGNLANALVSIGRPNDAIPHYQEALRLRPDYPEAHFNLGNTLAGVGRIAEAINQYQQTLRLRPDFPGARGNLNRLLQK